MVYNKNVTVSFWSNKYQYVIDNHNEDKMKEKKN